MIKTMKGLHESSVDHLRCIIVHVMTSMRNLSPQNVTISCTSINFFKKISSGNSVSYCIIPNKGNNFTQQLVSNTLSTANTQHLCVLFVITKAWGTAFVVEFQHTQKLHLWMKGVQWAVSSRCTWRWQRPQQQPLTLLPLISHCTFLPLFPLHFSHVLSYMISLEPDKTPGEGFCSWGHRPGSVSGLQLLIILS